MPEKFTNKIVINGVAEIDLTNDTAVANKVLDGYYFHLATGERVEGTCDFNSNTSDDTVSTATLLSGITAHDASGSSITGAMVNRGAQTSTISTKAQSVTIQQGYHDGSGSVSIDSTEQAKIIESNIKNGVEILGITGTYTGSELIKATTGNAIPSFSSKTVLPSASGDYDYFTQFTVAAIPVTRTDNVQGGVTVTVG